MRSGAFQTACMREVIRARELAQAMEQAMWEVREAAELVQEQLSSRLLATQVKGGKGRGRGKRGRGERWMEALGGVRTWLQTGVETVSQIATDGAEGGQCSGGAVLLLTLSLCQPLPQADLEVASAALAKTQAMHKASHPWIALPEHSQLLCLCRLPASHCHRRTLRSPAQRWQRQSQCRRPCNIYVYLLNQACFSCCSSRCLPASHHHRRTLK